MDTLSLRFFVLFAVAGFGTACEAERGTTPTSTVRDSASIRIVESSAPAWSEADAWALSVDPVLAIGTEAGGPPLGAIRGATKLSDGRFAVADGTSSSILFFRSDGTFEMEAGGPGEGPGEFSSIFSMRRYRGDSLIVYDGGIQRHHFLGPDGEFGRLIQRIPDSWIVHEVGAYLPDGDLLWTIGAYFPVGITESGWQDGHTLSSDPEGARFDTILARPFLYREFDGEDPVRYLYGPDGRFAAHMGGLVWARTDRPEFQVFDVDGWPVGIVRWSPERVPVTSAMIESLLDERLATLREQGADAERIRSTTEDYRSRKTPEFVPAINTLSVDPNGNVWVSERRLPGDESGLRWQVFDASGVWLGAVDFPVGLSPLEFGSDYVLGRILDDLDVPTIVLHEIVKP